MSSSVGWGMEDGGGGAIWGWRGGGIPEEPPAICRKLIMLK